MADTILNIEKQLKEVEKKLQELRTPPIQYGEGYARSLYEQMDRKKVLNRELSLAKGLETAILIDNLYPWCSGAPLPHVVSGMNKTFLIYYLASSFQADAHKIIALDEKSEYITVLIEFNFCYCYKFGGMNDEVFHGHPLYEQGLEGYEAHYIENSSWIKGEMKIQSAHHSHNPNKPHWLDNYKHYFFTFHDEVFECIAQGYTVELFRGNIKAVYDIASGRLFE